MSNSIDPDETAHYEPSHLDLCCLQKIINFAYSSERVYGETMVNLAWFQKRNKQESVNKQNLLGSRHKITTAFWYIT